jgi:transposase InsO family protein
MPWQEVSIMSLRREFVTLATTEGVSLRELCRRFGISAPTAYKWLGRYAAEGVIGLLDRSRRPKRSPTQTSQEMEDLVLGVRDAHPVWGGRKIRRRLLDRGSDLVPSASTITAILRRHDRLAPEGSTAHRPWQRFEHPEPNQLWQMDFKGHIPLGHGRCHPLTVLDDHSRFALGLEACGDERGETVQGHLTTLFRHYGLPDRILMDNGSPWGQDVDHPYTPLTVWLLRLGVGVSHGRPYHPQTQGKDERFHQTLKAEVLQGRLFRDLPDAQRAFDAWRPVYNFERPHEALAMATPGSRYRPSLHPFPETLPPIEYGPGDQVRKVQDGGEISWHSRAIKVGNAFRGYPVALRPTLVDGVWDVFFCRHQIKTLDLREPDES